MKYIRVMLEGMNKEIYAVMEQEHIYPLNQSPLFPGFKRTGEKRHIEEIMKFLPPVEPAVIIALGLNYAAHAREGGMDIPSAPVVFLKAVTAASGHLSPIVLPLEAPDFVDYEAELTVVIGKKAKNITPEEAPEYIMGYTCGNDVSARDCQMKLDRQWARAKSFDTFAPFGPCIVTGVETGNLSIQTRLNGKVMQDSNTADMIFGVPETVSYLSRQMTLLPGTFIMTGTPSGVGVARNPQVFMRHGDEVEVEIEGIGILKNNVVLEK